MSDGGKAFAGRIDGQGKNVLAHRELAGLLPAGDGPDADVAADAALADQLLAVAGPTNLGHVAGMSLQDLERLARGDFPDSGSAVEGAARREISAAGRERQAIDVAVVPDQCLDQLSRSDIPKPNDAVDAAGGDQLAVGAERGNAEAIANAPRFDAPTQNPLDRGRIGNQGP